MARLLGPVPEAAVRPPAKPKEGLVAAPPADMDDVSFPVAPEAWVALAEFWPVVAATLTWVLDMEAAGSRAKPAAKPAPMLDLVKGSTAVITRVLVLAAVAPFAPAAVVAPASRSCRIVPAAGKGGYLSY